MVVVVSLIIVLLSFDLGLLGQCLAICPSCLQTKQFSLSVVVKMRYTVSSKVMVNESGIFLASSGLTSTCLLKLRMWEYSASVIPAFKGVILEQIRTSFFLRCLQSPCSILPVKHLIR